MREVEPQHDSNRNGEGEPLPNLKSKVNQILKNGMTTAILSITIDKSSCVDVFIDYSRHIT